jgi:hypothetical protein
MAGIAPAIHVLHGARKRVDGRNKSGHDEDGDEVSEHDVLFAVNTLRARAIAPDGDDSDYA